MTALIVMLSVGLIMNTLIVYGLWLMHQPWDEWDALARSSKKVR